MEKNIHSYENMISPGKIFARLNELKKWQQAQQERLLKLHRNDSSQQSFADPEDKLVVFENDVNNVEPKVQPKRPYLKKGTGLLRYRLNKNQNRCLSNDTVDEKDVLNKGTDEKLLNSPTSIAQPKNGEHLGEQPFCEETSERELMIFEALEQRASNSSFCSTNSSVLRILSSTPVKKTSVNDFAEKENDMDVDSKIFTCERLNNSSSVENRLSDIIEDEYIPVADSDVIHTKSKICFDDSEEWSAQQSCEENTSLTLCVEKRSIGTMTDRDPETQAPEISDEMLVKKIEELDVEIKTFRMQNYKIIKIQNELEEEKRILNKTKKQLEEQIKEELNNGRAQLEEDRKKLMKERMVFEKYVKDKPTRKEREEISLLKTELENIKETLKCKETKNSTNQARLRNKIKHLESENYDLKEECEKLRKQNAKLTVTVRKPNDTKLLHDINKNLSKLAEFKSFLKKNDFDRNNSTESLKPTAFEEPTMLHNKSNDSFKETMKKSYSRQSEVMDTNVANEEVKAVENKENIEDIENAYEDVFKNFQTSLTSKKLNVSHINENILSDGSKEITYENGNVKLISADGNLIKVKYFNGDIKETNLLQGTINYYFCKTNTWNTTFADGSEFSKFPNGQIEKKHKDGSYEVQFPNQFIKKVTADGTEEIIYPDKSVVILKTNGEKILLMPNGQKEIHTKDEMRREYPDGTVKILYPDGSQETRYNNGRIRLKDKHGALLLDTRD